MIRVAIATEHRIPRWALGEALAKQEGLEITGEAGSIDETLAMIEAVKPDVLIVDPMLPDHGGFDVLAQLREISAGPLVIVLAPHADASYAARAIAAGAHGFVSMSAAPEALVEAIRAVHRGEQVIPAGVEAQASALTAREQQVMEMLARGMTNREIAHDLEISLKTVDTHRGHTLKKLGLRNNAELARFAVRHGYVTL